MRTTRLASVEWLTEMYTAEQHRWRNSHQLICLIRFSYYAITKNNNIQICINCVFEMGVTVNGLVADSCTILCDTRAAYLQSLALRRTVKLFWQFKIVFLIGINNEAFAQY